MGFLDFLGLGGNEQQNKGGVNVSTLMPAWQEGLGQDLSEFIKNYLKYYKPGEPYGGRLSAGGPAPLEQRGLDELSRLLDQPITGELYGAGKQQLLDTLSGKFADPSQSPFIQSYTNLAKQNLQDAITEARGRRGARGTYFTRAGLQEESRLGERTQNMLNSLIGQFIDAERGRMFQAAPIAQSMEEYGTLTAPLKRIAASQTLGSLPRVLEQADLERAYQDFKRQRGELSELPSLGTSLFGTRVPQVVESYGPAADPSTQTSPWIQALLSSSSPQAGASQGQGMQWQQLILPLLMAAI